MKKHNLSTFLIFMLLPLAVGSLSALFSGQSTIYSSLQKPALSPPAAIFPIVWTVLYLLMGLSSYLIYLHDDPGREQALKTYALQLFFNFFWSIIFFGFSQYLLAFIWLLLLIVLILRMIVQFYRISPLAAYLQIPYLIWCLFAAYLNFMIYQMNG